MKTAFAFACAATVLALAACTPPTHYADAKPGQLAEPPVQRERLAYLERTADEPVTCTGGPDCASKWARAREWVTKHSSYSIKTNTDSEIATNGPLEPTTDSAFTVTKVALDATTTAIRFASTCGKTSPCVPSTLELGSSFNNFVMYGN